jgi:hypothetical protein
MFKAESRFITRRAILSVLSMLPAAAVPALPAPDVADASSRLQPPPDPVFAAIAAHERATADLLGFADELAAAEQAAWHAPRGARRAANRQLKLAYAEERRFGDALDAATERFVATVPHTLQGAVAALAYVRERYAEGDPIFEEEECMTLFASIEAAIRRTDGRNPVA